MSRRVCVMGLAGFDWAVNGGHLTHTHLFTERLVARGGVMRGDLLGVHEPDEPDRRSSLASRNFVQLCTGLGSSRHSSVNHQSAGTRRIGARSTRPFLGSPHKKATTGIYQAAIHDPAHLREHRRSHAPHLACQSQPWSGGNASRSADIRYTIWRMTMNVSR